MHQSVALRAVTTYRPETQTNKLKLIFSEFLTFVWLLSLKWGKWQKSDKNCKSVTLTSFAGYATETHPPPPSPRPPTLSGELSIGLVLKPRYSAILPAPRAKTFVKGPVQQGISCLRLESLEYVRRCTCSSPRKGSFPKQRLAIESNAVQN